MEIIRWVVLGLVATASLVGCANTKVTKWAAPQGKEIMIGKGGAFETVQSENKSIDVWTEGSPNRPFKIIAKTTSTYRYGTADKALAQDAARAQMIDAVIENGGDAIIYGSHTVESVGVIYQPGMQMTNVQATSRSTYTANTFSAPGIAGNIGEGTIHGYVVKYMDAP